MKLKDISQIDKAQEPPYEPYIIVVLTEKHLDLLPAEFLREGGWRPSGESDLWVRVNAPKPQMNLPANAHVAHKKHLSAKEKQVSWEASAGRRHDRMTFDTNFSPMEKAKKVARAALRLPDDFPLEQLSQDSAKILLLESDANPQGRVFLRGANDV